MSCDNCEALQCDVDYLEGRIDSLNNDNSLLEIENEKLLIETGRLEDALAALQDELDDQVDFKAEIAMELSRYRLSRPHLVQHYEAEQLIIKLCGFLGVEVCL